MDLAAGHDAGHGVPDSRLDARRLVGDDQDVLAVIALEILSLIGREPDREVVVIAELELGRIQFWIRNFCALNQPMDFRPELRSHLPLSGRGRKHNAFVIACQPPQGPNRQRESLADPVTGFHRGSAVGL
jgi:hypothetical protein